MHFFRLQPKIWLCFSFIWLVSTYAYPHSAQRVVSLAVSADVILFDIAEKTGDWSQIQAFSYLVDQPQFSLIASQHKPTQNRAGSSLESIIQLKPDLVIAASYTSAERLKALKDLNIRTLILKRFSSLDELFANTLEVGKALGHQTAAQQIITMHKQRLHAIQARLKSLKQRQSFLYFSTDGSTPGRGTTLDLAAQHAGLIGLGAQAGIQGWQKLSRESLLKLSPDVILSAGINNTALLERLRQDPIWRYKPAVQSGTVHAIAPALLTTTSHRIVDLIMVLFERTYGSL